MIAFHKLEFCSRCYSSKLARELETVINDDSCSSPTGVCCLFAVRCSICSILVGWASRCCPEYSKYQRAEGSDRLEIHCFCLLSCSSDRLFTSGQAEYDLLLIVKNPLQLNVAQILSTMSTSP